MGDERYEPGKTGLLLVDPYNDFLSEGGKLWPAVKKTAEAVDLLKHLREVTAAARAAGIQVFVVPHRRWRPGDYQGWRQQTSGQKGANEKQLFAVGSWGGEWHPDFAPQEGDVLVGEHWAQSGFANTDLDMQLKQHRVEKIVLVGMVANTCLESTGRFGMELGYHVTLVRDATAAFSEEAMHAAHQVNGPSFAHAIVTTEELLGQFSKG
ncbi:isochorismatase family cysteine hydrolase [Chondromyces apiculatus]|uniref:Isochorismatase n=1 Tax=Chondromyces apiculatus DSM 436 TaxID=1192034 RepID=A0A017T5A6_9BACT|nr:isochorismatase family cysteine hydrolase [Chondromyces apiculatus]EYF03985.1 Isochorismatase [Chondromyces apiculatus DSM 436]